MNEKKAWAHLGIAVAIAAVVIIVVFGLLGKGVFNDGAKSTTEEIEAPLDQGLGELSDVVADGGEVPQDIPAASAHQPQEVSADMSLVLGEPTSQDTPEDLLIEMPTAITNHTLTFVWVGEVTDTTAEIEVSYDLFQSNPAEASITYEQADGRRRSRTRHIELPVGQELAVFALEGLQASTLYTYTIAVEDTNEVAPSVLPLPTGSFHTQPEETETVVPIPLPDPEPRAPETYQVEHTRNIAYAWPDGIELRANVYQPADYPGDSPVVVWVHGGGWDSGNRNGADAYADEFAQRGVAVVSVEYRLVTEGADYEDMVEDIRAGIALVHARAGDFSFDTNNIILLGTSSGGTNVALVGAAQEGTGASAFGMPSPNERVEKVINVFGPTDFVALADHFGAAMTESRSASGRAYFGECPFAAYQARTCLGFADASPVNYIDDDMPAFLTLHGDNDTSVPVAQSIEFHARALGAGASSRFLRSNSRGHDKGIILDYLDEVIDFIFE